jgi:hypothetical protein
MNRRPKAIKPSPMLSKVPNITKLYEELGIRNAPIHEAAEFVNQTHKWRKSYHTHSGQLAADLNHWNNLDVQSGLQEVAEKFLETYGESYWSANVGWDHRLRYTDDKDR